MKLSNHLSGNIPLIVKSIQLYAPAEYLVLGFFALIALSITFAITMGSE